MKKTKIVATIGPASKDKEILKKMIEGGLNVARINFSHGTYESNGELMKNIRELSKELKVNVGIIADLQGPRIRVGNAEEFVIEKGEVIYVSDKKNHEGEKELIIDSDGVAKVLEIGERVLIEDGIMELRIIEKLEEGVRAEVLNGGLIRPRKGINLPDTKLNFGAVTKKDEEDLKYALSQEVDFVALSFVSNGKEIEDTRKKMKKILGRENNIPHIIAKVERKEAVNNIDEIISASDVIMVARGDLGIELEETKVVVYQKLIIAKCLKAYRPVIVATQMMDSMIRNPIPTRAEVSDVSNAVIDHTDAVMLSGESANGLYPIKSVEMMSRIISDTEDSPYDDYCRECEFEICDVDYNAIICSAHEMAKKSGASAILAISLSGFTGRMLSHKRSKVKLLVVTNSEKVCNQLSVIWGVESYFFPDKDIEGLIDRMIVDAKEKGSLKAGDKAVVIFGRKPGGEKMQLVGIMDIV